MSKNILKHTIKLRELAMKKKYGNNPYKSMKVYICRYGHAYPTPHSPYCYYCWESGKKTALLEAIIKNIRKQTIPTKTRN